ncbi:ABC transporter substrate-binding protein [Alicyclobacillus mali (ex Roth et al. 2021)]|uniref:ABC transporter substrate-binding protein n=1 Tax=Alicyclobacillus mali (ex Roth et al. 2021) TaxID=1123961 RepID=UPI000835465F|nr:extracellular solute-binding protein [Alicyclobacillus mali (ex Roth et al. 2021)]
MSGKKLPLFASLIATIIGATGCGATMDNSSPSTSEAASTGKITLEFLQNKPEVVNQWNEIIEQFERKYPNIVVKQINPPNTDTTLQADVAKNQLPDIVAMGADATFIQMAQNGVFVDLSSSSMTSRVSPSYLAMLEREVGKKYPYGIPYTVNAVPIIYNVTLFNKYHLSIPRTWSQLMNEAEAIRKKGGTPFYNGFKDSWTIAPIWCALAANTEGADFIQKLKSGKASFSTSDVAAAERLKQFVSMGQSNQFGVDYNDANAAFANGKSVFYAQGIWTIPVLRTDNPNIKLGTFVLPATNDPSSVKMVSGIDTLLAITNTGDTAREQAALKFVSFLLSPSVASEYASDAGLFSAVKGVKNTDPALQPLQAFITDGRVVDFDDHYYPPAMAAGDQYESLLQGSLEKNESVEQMLKQMDTLYSSAASH